jgi:hypothetical protein
MAFNRLKEARKNHMKKLSIGELEHNSEDVALKVESDIAFLAGRLHLLEQQAKPNDVIIQTYREMLDSRRAVLGWLRLGNTENDDKGDKKASRN